MTDINKTKLKLQSGEPVFGMISGINDPKVAELAGLRGLDYYMVDTEHSPMTAAQSVNIVRGCERVGITPLARVSIKDAKAVLPYIDGGALGVMMPGLETAEEVEMLVNAVKYPPFGKRGLGVARAAQYMVGERSQAEYVAWANKNTIVLPQFEDVALLDVLADMAAVPGVDGFMIGPRDLALSMGYTDGSHHQDVQKVIDKAIRIMRDAGVAAGITAGTYEATQAQLERGANLILTSLPGLMRLGVDTFLGR